MEEQRSTGGAERQVAQFVEDNEVGIGEPPCDLPGFPLALLLFEGVDEFDGGEEPNALAVMFDGLDADGRGQMRFARAWAADQDDVVRVLEELALWSWRTSASFTSLLAKSKPAEVAIVREAGGL